MKQIKVILGTILLLSKFCLAKNACKKEGGKCLALPNSDQQDYLEAWYEQCAPIDDDALCQGEELKFCCTGNMDMNNKDINNNNNNIKSKKETSLITNIVPAIETRIWGNKCKGAGGECKWGSCHYGTVSPDDCPFGRNCCRKPPCNAKFWSCTIKGGYCYQSSINTCPNDLFEIVNGCSTNWGATCRCCAPCKKKLFQCLSGRCTTGQCQENEVLFQGKCRDNQCHCCQPCRKKFLRCLGGRCTKNSCSDQEVTYQGECTHETCHCCGPCKKKNIFSCIDGRCVRNNIQCKADEDTILGQCKDKSCHCCKKSCPDINCNSLGGRCKSFCPILYYEISDGQCGNNCKCCKFSWPVLSENDQTQQG